MLILILIFIAVPLATCQFIRAGRHYDEFDDLRRSPITKDKYMQTFETTTSSPNSTNVVLAAGWISVDDRPLLTKDEKGNWMCTGDGDKEFIAAVPYADNLWWIRHCVVEGAIGLCVVGDDYNEPAGWQLEDVAYWMPWVVPPACR